MSRRLRAIFVRALAAVLFTASAALYLAGDVADLAARAVRDQGLPSPVKSQAPRRDPWSEWAAGEGRRALEGLEG